MGDYTLTLEKAGFKKVTQTHLNLIAGANARADFTLEVGAGLMQVVEVKGAAPLVEERTTALGVALEPQHMVDLPLQVNQNRRTPYSYLAAVPGVENAGFANNVNGGVGLNNEVLVDGLGAEYNPAVGSVINGPPSV